MVMFGFSYRIRNAVGLFQYSKSVWSNVGTPTVYIFISCAGHGYGV